MKQQTAVDWLFDKLTIEVSNGVKLLNANLSSTDISDLIRDAKKMEKEQINQACYDGYYQEELYDVRNYYNDTYGNNN